MTFDPMGEAKIDTEKPWDNRPNVNPMQRMEGGPPSSEPHPQNVMGLSQQQQQRQPQGVNTSITSMGMASQVHVQ